ncbi:hypothetical protein COCNU_scaffold003116G000100 [Cocos nucifera]|nr:hypothetical protein [Cocos nucifera]
MALCACLENLRALPPLLLLLFFLGLLSVLKLSFAILRWLYVSFLRPTKNLRARYCSWAIVDAELMRNLIKINVEGVTRVAHAVLPGMLERKRGAIVNIGSGAASIIPSDPLYAVYAATKAYVDQFSRCLYVEYKNKGIDVQCQAPLYVTTRMTSIRRSSFFVPSTDTYAHAALQWIGYEPRCASYWPHS